MSDCAYGSNSPLGQWGPVKISGCSYESSSPVDQVMSISKAFLLLVRVRLTNKSRLILVGAAVSFVRLLTLATVVVIFRTVSRVMADKTDSRSNKNQPGIVRQSYSDKKQKGLGD